MLYSELKRVIVIGASAGGFAPLRHILGELSSDNTVMAVVHMSVDSNAYYLSNYFQKQTSLTCRVPAGGENPVPGNFYLAPENRHMMVKDGIIKINMGARENKYRPSIDVLFRSAAVSYGSGVIGIILSGMLDDGTSGMSAIKRCGGICIVQDPSDTEFPEMPQSVINNLEVDYKVSLAEMGPLLRKILGDPIPPPVPVPEELKIEAEITEKMMTSIDDLDAIADRSDFTCPECGGGLWAIRNDPTHRYRCYTGHVFTEQVLYDMQGYNLEESVWVSIRILEEKRNILKLMAVHSDDDGRTMLAADQRRQAADIEKHIEGMKFILQKLTAKDSDSETRA